MTLYPWIREFVKKYTFVKDTKFKLGTFYIYYEKEGKTTRKSLPYRATRDQLISCIESIKKDIHYYEEKAKKDENILEDMRIEKAIAFTNGETNDR